MARLPRDLQALVQQAQRMQSQIQAAHAELEQQEFEGTAGGGAVRAVVSGEGSLAQVEFGEGVLDPDDPELVADLVVAAVNQALASYQEAASSVLGGMEQSLDLGGLLG